MKHFNRLLTLSLLILCALPTWAQQVMITREFEEVPMSSVLALYKNEFGKHVKPALDDTFPFALFQVQLEGNANEVKQAKEHLRLYLGQLTAVQDVCLDYPNEILFLIPSRARYIFMQCGDGCDEVTVMMNARLKSNTMYRGRVKYVPAEEMQQVEKQVIRKQMFTFEVTPTNAQVEIVRNGEKQPFTLTDGSVSMELNEGKYFYTVYADKYHPEEGTIEVSSNERKKVVHLTPTYGWLSVLMPTTIDEQQENLRISKLDDMWKNVIAIPVDSVPLDSGRYEVLMRKPRYYDYLDTITIHDGQLTTIAPQLNVDERVVMKTFILGEVGYSLVPQLSYGLMIGQTFDGLGWFASARSNFQTPVPTNGLVCGQGGVIDGIMPFYHPDKKTSSAKWHVNAGLVIDVLELSIKPDHYFDTFGFYIGAGYGVYQHAWQLNNGNWVEYGPTSASGVSATAGVIGSVHGFTLKAGVSTIGFKYMEIEAGIGWMF